MTNKTFNQLFNEVITHEGYYVNIPGDKGGETYMGIARNLHPNWQGWHLIDKYKNAHGHITRNTKIEVQGLTQIVQDFYQENFYEKYNIAKINNGPLQSIIFDWCVNSGNYGSIGVQKVLNLSFSYNLKVDGIIGRHTLKAINTCSPKSLFNAIKSARIVYYHTIAHKGQNHKFLNGWLNRIDSFQFSSK